MEQKSQTEELPVLDHLIKLINGEEVDASSIHMRYPTAISETLSIRIIDVKKGEATVAIDADIALHGNQQGTVHGGLLCELADAAIGTAHSTLMREGESFTTLELKINFFRPVWKEKIKATAAPIQSGKTITVYSCEIFKEDGKRAAQVISTVMTLRGEKAKGR